MVTNPFASSAWFVVPILLLAGGCGGPNSHEHGLPPGKGAEDLLEEATAAAGKGDCASAIPAATTALDSGLLLAELVDDALLVRAKCLAAEGRFDDALADLDEAGRGADDLSVVHAARGDVLLKKGDMGLAKAEYAMAKKMNPKVEVPAELR